MIVDVLQLLIINAVKNHTAQSQLLGESTKGL